MATITATEIATEIRKADQSVKHIADKELFMKFLAWCCTNGIHLQGQRKHTTRGQAQIYGVEQAMEAVQAYVTRKKKNAPMQDVEVVWNGKKIACAAGTRGYSTVSIQYTDDGYISVIGMKSDGHKKILCTCCTTA